ncbi:MAG TPA: nuclear transport factor 2 family protein [Longimicrobium sp.]|nr:nuclear transport factor 2 family protein [Longimicrobium sp.]
MSSTEQEIRAAIDQFYSGLTQALNGDPGPILAAWSHGPEATAMHPAGGRQLGWEEVRGAWEQWSAGVVQGEIRPADVAIRLLTPDVAIVSGLETGGGTIAGERIAVDARMTLVLRREGGRWRAVHHHVDVIPDLRQAVARAMTLAGAAG